MLLLCFEEGNRASCLWERERILGLSFLLFPASRFYCFHFYLGKGSFHACSLFEASKDSFVCYRILLIMKMIKLRSACFMIPSTHLCLLKIFPPKAFGCRKSRGQSWELKIVILWLDYKFQRKIWSCLLPSVKSDVWQEHLCIFFHWCF
ncbi:uncharacterized protein LOC127120107 isoform X3 [Lathyrus oleraceus]|uniref:uncharacterized protein LOC127120107 isoform X2 n=1 Tax=Pisum sativum TaxID=3888 RepID=UPI0021CE0D31|nr:uncharacterized protein LOC127120107 isoform X2 [Pisum sativum]XP_050906447.1 uncharacterized protein LOC127120107 isoform X3 [Pisum sativum]